ncbi:protein DA1-related 1-like [Salvia splendens]|uniref:protein DA1-related 1-like n=1 Tax=Salvia splendens TaxID=180675 RepID=UPI001C264E09|nr:protein DA1-related 1-like [Salvia splendens]
MSPKPYRLVRKCEVTAILILYGYPNLIPEVEAGICPVLSHMWLDSEINAGSGSNAASASTSAASSSGSSKKGKRSEFEKKLGQYFIQRIESGSSAVYGHSFREANKAVLRYGLRRTLDHIRLTGRFPC